jgi:hypothetical protein
LLLRYIALIREEVVLAKTNQRDGLTRVIVEYVIDNIILGYPKNKEHSANAIIQELQIKYTLTRGEDLK